MAHFDRHHSPKGLLTNHRPSRPLAPQITHPNDHTALHYRTRSRPPRLSAESYYYLSHPFLNNS